MLVNHPKVFHKIIKYFIGLKSKSLIEKEFSSWNCNHELITPPTISEYLKTLYYDPNLPHANSIKIHHYDELLWRIDKEKIKEKAQRLGKKAIGADGFKDTLLKNLTK